MRDSVDMDDTAAQFAERTFVRTVMFSYTMYCMSVPGVGCDRSCPCYLYYLQILCTIRSNEYEQPSGVYCVLSWMEQDVSEAAKARDHSTIAPCHSTLQGVFISP